MYASFHRVRGLGYLTVSEILETVYENDLFDMFPEFSNVAHILAVHYLLHRVIQSVAQIENLPPQHHGATTCQ